MVSLKMGPGALSSQIVISSFHAISSSSRAAEFSNIKCLFNIAENKFTLGLNHGCMDISCVILETLLDTSLTCGMGMWSLPQGLRRRLNAMINWKGHHHCCASWMWGMIASNSRQSLPASPSVIIPAEPRSEHPRVQWDPYPVTALCSAQSSS